MSAAGRDPRAEQPAVRQTSSATPVALEAMAFRRELVAARDRSFASQIIAFARQLVGNEPRDGAACLQLMRATAFAALEDAGLRNVSFCLRTLADEIDPPPPAQAGRLDREAA